MPPARREAAQFNRSVSALEATPLTPPITFSPPPARIHSFTFWQQMAFLRISVSLLALITAIGVAYLAIWQGLGGGSSLSPANTHFAVKTGVYYGCILMLVVNCIPYRNRKQTMQVAAFTVLGLHLVFGFGLMIWTAAIASV